MDWIYLGHAMWLCQVGDLRLLFDPLLMPTHHGGVFEVVPQRTIHAGALKPDFIVVSHRHPDHFDVPSLAKLATYDRDAVVLTSDNLVVAAAEQLGFRQVAKLEDLQTVTLDGVKLFTTPSYSTQIEWGVIVEADGYIAWNQVDTVHRGPDDIAATLTHASKALGVDCHRPHLVLAQWAPLLEVAAVTAGRIGFPTDAYRRVLACARATNAEVLVPASAGTQHVGPSSWLNSLVHPLSLDEFVRESNDLLDDGRVEAVSPGSRLRVGTANADADLVSLTPSVLVAPAQSWPFMTLGRNDDHRHFCPTRIPELTDPIDERASAAQHLDRCRRWIEGDLVPALRAWHQRTTLDAVFALAIVSATQRQAWTFRLSAGHLNTHVGQHPDFDVYNAVAASRLCAVLDADMSWGDVLLGGFLRVVVRRARLVEGLPNDQPFPPVFLYEALGYDESHEKTVARELEHLTSKL